MSALRGPDRACPWCGHTISAASNMEADDAAMPEAGDHSVCLYCANLLTFTGDGLEVRAANLEELKAAQSNPMIMRLRRLVAAEMRR